MQIEVVELPQSNGGILYGAHVGGYVVCHGYPSYEEAFAAAVKWVEETRDP